MVGKTLLLLGRPSAGVCYNPQMILKYVVVASVLAASARANEPYLVVLGIREGRYFND